MRTRTGRPHWLVMDEAHHLVPASWEPGASILNQDFDRMILITVHPDLVAPAILSLVHAVVAVGQSPETTLRQFCQVVGEPEVRVPATKLDPGEVLFWRRQTGVPPLQIKVPPSRA